MASPLAYGAPSGYGGAALLGFTEGLDQGAQRRSNESLQSLRELQIDDLTRRMLRARQGEEYLKRLNALPPNEMTLAQGYRTPDIPGVPGQPPLNAALLDEGPLPAAAAEAQRIVGTPPVPGVDVPAVTLPGRSMEDVRSALGAEAAAWLSTTPEGRLGTEAAGVYSDKEIASKRALAKAGQAAQEHMATLRDPKALRDPLRVASTFAALNMQQEILLAATNPERSAQAGTLARRYYAEASLLAKDEDERKLANKDFGPISEALLRISKPDGATPENFDLLTAALRASESRFGQTFATDYYKLLLPMQLKRLEDAPTRTLFTNLQAALDQQPPGRSDLKAAFADAVRVTPDGRAALTRVMMSEGPVGKLARETLFGQDIPKNDIEVAVRATDAVRIPRRAVGPDGVVGENPAWIQNVGRELEKIRTRLERPGVREREGHTQLQRAIGNAKGNVGTITSELNRLRQDLKAAKDPLSGSVVQQRAVTEKIRTTEERLRLATEEYERLRKRSLDAVAEGEPSAPPPVVPPPPALPSVTPPAVARYRELKRQNPTWTDTQLNEALVKEGLAQPRSR